MLLLIDNFDSFTYNLVHYFGELGENVIVKRNDALSVQDAINLKPTAIIISPGPSTPTYAGICIDLTRAAYDKNIPLLGVCLGHQTIGQAFSGEIVKAKSVMHGKKSIVTHTGSKIFDGVPTQFETVRYHSLVISNKNFPNCLT